MVRALALLPFVAAADDLVSGSGHFRYKYMKEKLQLPPGTNSSYCHGVVLDDKANLYLTYKDDNHPERCMLKWSRRGGYKYPTIMNPDPTVCKGTVHGLRLAKEHGHTFLYHANNEQALYKTTLDGRLIWSNTELPSTYDSSDAYKPTWFAVPPKGDYLFMADGYGSSRINLHSREDGRFLNISFGGEGKDDMHFETCHAISWDPRSRHMVVSDRENHRLVFFDIDPEFKDPQVWKHFKTTKLVDDTNRPCQVRFGADGAKASHPDLEKHAIVAELDGEVHILDEQNTVVSTIEVRKLIGESGSENPHDALFLPNGDIVVATWNPGRMSYWKRLGDEDVVV